MIQQADPGRKTIDFRRNDGGREAAGFAGRTGDCAVRAFCILTGADYAATFESFAQAKLQWLKEQGKPITECETKSMFTDGVHEALLDKLYQAAGLRRAKLNKRIGYAEAYRRYGDCIVCITDPVHTAAIVNGAVEDIIDTRYRKIAGHDGDGRILTRQTAIDVYYLEKRGNKPAGQARIKIPEEWILAAIKGAYYGLDRLRELRQTLQRRGILSGRRRKKPDVEAKATCAPAGNQQ